MAEAARRLTPALRRAVRHALAEGDVIACPTEAVWGLGCDPFREDALQRLLALKRRAPAKGLIVVATGIEQLGALVQLPPKDTLARALATWPGPATWVFPAGPAASPTLTGGRDTLAVRVSAHPVVRALCEAWGGPLVSTSANRSGRAPARSRTEVQIRFPEVLAVPGALGGLDKPTPIRDVMTGHYWRT
jgi:L-threonylcarbamoyladenylate synthase